ASSEFSTLSLHDALPISLRGRAAQAEPEELRPDVEALPRPARSARRKERVRRGRLVLLGSGEFTPVMDDLDRRILATIPKARPLDRKSTRLNSSHVAISY